MFAEVTAVVTELAHQATIQTASDGAASVSSAARASLRADLRHICRTAGVVLADQPDLKKRFRLPESGDVR